MAVVLVPHSLYPRGKSTVAYRKGFNLFVGAVAVFRMNMRCAWWVTVSSINRNPKTKHKKEHQNIPDPIIRTPNHIQDQLKNHREMHMWTYKWYIDWFLNRVYCELLVQSFLCLATPQPIRASSSYKNTEWMILKWFLCNIWNALCICTSALGKEKLNIGTSHPFLSPDLFTWLLLPKYFCQFETHPLKLTKAEQQTGD